ncbi:OprD family porin [Pseudomonas mangrovi]|uniref:Outer membrane porin, OprD family n=1 Tax=Pseudomonas mangrovi TaxID=2161748 RepID=A0A2T5P9E7_9PSED|nr:OprD family porin [Pseudomonas mangrovi]PTU74366.1 outer membrane porin, OprD family [Pseudomonas mangrovi]
MKALSVSLAVAAALVTQQAFSAGFIEDSNATLGLRNFVYHNDIANRDDAPSAREWGQGFLFNYSSGYTRGPVGFGLDAVALIGVKLDSGGDGGSPTDSRTPGALFPRESNGEAVDNYSKGGLTAKLRFSKTEARLGILQPKLPVVTFNDGRLLPQTFDGGQITSNEIENLTLTAGQLESTTTRSSTDSIGLRIAGAAAANGIQADSNTFYFAGGDYKIGKDLLAQYYYGNLEDFYQQHFLGLTHTLALGDGSLKSDLRYFDSRSDGKNASAAGRAQGYRSSGYWNGAAANPDRFEVDNQTWSALFTYSQAGHSLGVGYQQLSGSSAFPFLSQGDGATAYLITDRQIGKFLSAGERTWLAEYGYDFAKLGVPGLKASVAYLKGDNVNRAGSDAEEWERDLRVDYTVQNGALKGLGLSWRNAILRGDVADDAKENRLIASYSIALL